MFASVDRTWTGTTTPGPSGPGSNGNEGVLNIPQSSRCSLVTHDTHLLWRGSYLLCTLYSQVSLSPVDRSEKGEEATVKRTKIQLY